MAMHDPRMQNLFDEEGPRGIGTYWIIIEKLSLLPDAKAQLKYLRSSTSKKLSITYIEKIIRNFQLFVLEEDGSFSPEELNPVKKKEKKTAKSDRAKSREVFKENIKDITTSAIKEKETAAADDVNFNPIRPWQEVVDGLAVRTPWLEAACIHSGYGELLMRHIKAAVDCFKKHIEVYDKWRNLLSESDARCYFVNFTNPGQRTSQALYATLLALDAKQQSAAPPDPYRYEQRIDGRRTYLGCLIPDNAPPRPDNTAFWNETTNSWRS